MSLISKQCAMCKQFKPTEEFNKNKNNTLRNECKECQKEKRKHYQRNYYQNNKIRLNEQRRRREENNKEYHKNYNKKGIASDSGSP